jgi:hypothetical protein
VEVRRQGIELWSKLAGQAGSRGYHRSCLKRHNLTGLGAHQDIAELVELVVLVSHDNLSVGMSAK